MTILVALLLVLTAHAQPAPVAEAPVARPLAEAPLAGPTAERVRGEWVIVLSDDERRAIDLIAFAFSDPMPTPEAIAAKELTPDEAMTVELFVGMRRANPDGAELAEMKRVLLEVGSTTLTITTDDLTFGIAGQRATGRYEVLEDTGQSLKIRHHPPNTAPREATLTVLGEFLVMTDSGNPVRFRRK